VGREDYQVRRRLDLPPGLIIQWSATNQFKATICRTTAREIATKSADLELVIRHRNNDRAIAVIAAASSCVDTDDTTRAPPRVQHRQRRC
jgi:hypothetical protein